MALTTIGDEPIPYVSGPGEGTAARPRVFRPDLQGLRAIAVSMVVIYHLWPRAVPGGFVGVDVFFVISGYLITSHLSRTFQRDGKIRLLEFWGRRARRLLPAAAFVLTATWLVGLVVQPAARLSATAEQVRASALYYQNWVLARDAVDYLTSADSPSPVQHFWSLSVEEQFYLFWPFVFVAAALVARKGGRAVGRAAAASVAAALVTASLWYSSQLTGTDPAAAYFVSTTRIWELGVGGLLALMSGPITARLGRVGSVGWLGLFMVAASALVIGASSPFPGTLALLPVVGAALLIAAGSPEATGGPWRLTSNRPMVFIGDISYSLYLWHWPIIVLWIAATNPRIGLIDGPAIVALSALLAWLTKVHIEDRVRLSPRIAQHTGRSLATALAVLVPVALTALHAAPTAPHGGLDAQHPGGTSILDAQLSPETAVASLNLLPSPAQAPLDLEPFSACETPIPKVAPRPCFYGDRTDPRLTVALVGDSVAGQYKPVLQDLAQKRHWLLITDLHGGCPWTATLLSNFGQSNRYTQCQEWGAQVLDDLLTRYRPDVVVTSDRPVLGTPAHPRADAVSFRQTAQGMVAYWRKLLDAGTQVVAIRESPEPGRNIPDCLSTPGATIGMCTASTADALTADTPIAQAVKAMHGEVEMVDPNRLICTQTTCPPIVGNVIVYRDTHHLTLTYVRSIQPALQAELLATKALGHR